MGHTISLRNPGLQHCNLVVRPVLDRILLPGVVRRHWRMFLVGMDNILWLIRLSIDQPTRRQRIQYRWIVDFAILPLSVQAISESAGTPVRSQEEAMMAPRRSDEMQRNSTYSHITLTTDVGLG